MNTPRTTIEIFSQNCRSIVDIALKNATTVIVLGPTLINEEITKHSEAFTLLEADIKEYNNVLKAICKEKVVQYISFFDKWEGLDTKTFISDDGIHPNELGHKRIFEAIKPEII